MNLKLKKGLNLRIAGAVADPTPREVKSEICAIVPDDFPGFIPKLDVKEGQAVKVGDALLHDKNNPDVCLVSPVSGTVKAVVRGERRKIEQIILANDGRGDAKEFDLNEPLPMLLGKSGLAAMMRNRPFDVVINPWIRPRDIFVTCFDTAPLAPNLADSLGKDANEMLAKAVKALNELTDGGVFMSVPDMWPFEAVQGAQTVTVQGPHPAGCVGIQIANIAPVNKGEDVWTMDVITLYKIGKLLATGKVDPTVLVSVTGSEVTTPYVAKTVVGAEIKALLKGQVNDDHRHHRIVAGNLLSGVGVEHDDSYLQFPYRQVTVIPNGDDVDEFMGWASLSLKKLSVNPAIPFRGLTKLFKPDSRLNGGRRAMIMSGEYDKVMPADIMVEYLLKAVISKNIDDMEALGIYEVAPEDLALCEFVDTSKLPIQLILRQGLDYLRKELL